MVLAIRFATTVPTQARNVRRRRNILCPSLPKEAEVASLKDRK